MLHSSHGRRPSAGPPPFFHSIYIRSIGARCPNKSSAVQACLSPGVLLFLFFTRFACYLQLFPGIPKNNWAGKRSRAHGGSCSLLGIGSWEQLGFGSLGQAQPSWRKASNLHSWSHTPQPTHWVGSMTAFLSFSFQEIAGQPMRMHSLQPLHLSGSMR